MVDKSEIKEIDYTEDEIEGEKGGHAWKAVGSAHEGALDGKTSRRRLVLHTTR